MKIEYISYKLQCDKCGTQIADKYNDSDPDYDEFDYSQWYTYKSEELDKHYCPSCSQDSNDYDENEENPIYIMTLPTETILESKTGENKYERIPEKLKANYINGPDKEKIARDYMYGKFGECWADEVSEVMSLLHTVNTLNEIHHLCDKIITDPRIGLNTDIEDNTLRDLPF